MNLRKIPMFACAGLLAAPCALYAGDHPLYLPELQRLQIPSIDTEQQQGAYHNATLEFVEGDLWRLKDISFGNDIPGVEKVRVIQTGSFPVQIFLEIEGWLGGCGKLDIGQRRVEDTFEVSIQWAYPREPLFVCTASVSQFSWIVPLPVYGLAAGEYRYSVNRGKQSAPGIPAFPGEIEVVDGGLVGSFVLGEDNVLEREAPEYPRVIPLPTSQVQLAR